MTNDAQTEYGSVDVLCLSVLPVQWKNASSPPPVEEYKTYVHFSVQESTAVHALPSTQPDGKDEGRKLQGFPFDLR